LPWLRRFAATSVSAILGRTGKADPGASPQR
jgi:hypothetical protein